MGRTHVILAAVADNRIYADGVLTGLVFPQNYIEFTADGTEVTWTINVRGATGSPSAWSLEARFLDVVEHTFGPQYSEPQTVPFTELQTSTYVEEGMGWGKPGATALVTNPDYDPAEFITNPSYNATSDPRGTIINPDFDPRERIWNPAVPRSAGDFGLIADQTDGLGGSTSATITRTVRCFNRRHKLELRPTFTGGTTPGLVVALTAQVH